MRSLLVACLSLYSVLATATEVTWIDLAKYAISQNKPTKLSDEQYKDVLVAISEPEWFAKNKDDQFALEEKRVAEADKFKTEIAKFDQSKVYTTNLDMFIGKYDFKTGSFPVDLYRGDDAWNTTGVPNDPHAQEWEKKTLPMARGMELYYQIGCEYNFGQEFGGDEFLSVFELFFANPLDIKPIKMSKEDAKVFLAKHKGNDKIYAVVNYVIRDAGQDDRLKAYAQITKMEYYRDVARKEKIAEQVINRPLLNPVIKPYGAYLESKAKFAFYGEEFTTITTKSAVKQISETFKQPYDDHEYYFENPLTDSISALDMFQDFMPVVNKFGLGYIKIHTLSEKPAKDSDTIGKQMKHPSLKRRVDVVGAETVNFVVVDGIKDISTVIQPFDDDSIEITTDMKFLPPNS